MAIALRSHKGTDSAASATTVQVTSITATLTGSLIVVGAANVGGRTVTGVTDNIGNTYTQATGAAGASIADTLGTDVWYCLSAASGVTSVTVTFSGGAGTFNKDAWVDEVTGFTTAAFDVAAALNEGSGVANVDTGAAVTTTSATGFVVGVVATSSGISANPTAANEFTAGGDIVANTLNAMCALISTTAAAHIPIWDDFDLHAAICGSTVAFKESAGGGRTTHNTRAFPLGLHRGVRVGDPAGL